jgi:GTP-binding protein HflX
VLRGLTDDTNVFVEDRLFATLDPLSREVKLDERNSAVVTDTVGFIRKLPHHLVASFRATLEEVLEADVLVHVIDASHPTWEEQRVVVDDVLHDLGVHSIPVIHAFNKIDRLESDGDGTTAAALRERIENLLPNSVFVSAVAPGGLEPLRRALLAASLASRRTFEVRVPLEDGRRLAEVYREGDVLERKLEDGAHVLTVREKRKGN